MKFVVIIEIVKLKIEKTSHGTHHLFYRMVYVSETVTSAFDITSADEELEVTSAFDITSADEELECFARLFPKSFIKLLSYYSYFCFAYVSLCLSVSIS